MALEEVSAVAEGRVWSATDALEVGLVDGLGDLNAAIDAAAARAELQNYEIDYVEPALSPSELLFQQLAERMGALGVFSRADSVAALVHLARPLLESAEVLSTLQDPRHLYMHCLACANTQ